MPKFVSSPQTNSQERIATAFAVATVGAFYPQERSVVIVREAGRTSSAHDYYGSDIALSVLEDAYWTKSSHVNINANDREQLILKPHQESADGSVFFLTAQESSFQGFVDTSLVVSSCSNHNPEDVWVSSKQEPTIEIPVTTQNVFLGGLFSDTGAEISDLTIGVGDLDAQPNSPFVLELNPDNDEARIHFYSPGTGRWQNLQLFKKDTDDQEAVLIPDTILNRVKVLVSTNPKATAETINGFSTGKSPEKVMFDEKKAISSEVAVRGKEEFFEPGHFFSPQYATEHTYVPSPEMCPQILYFAGPARGGTTAFGMLMAGVDGVERSYFQPHKDLIRHGRPLVIHPGDKTAVMKDTFGPLHEEELFDPVAMMIAAGIPKEKITVILTLRDPLACFASLTKFTDRMDPEYFARMQEHTLALYEQYKKAGINVIPFSYDLFDSEMGEQAVLERLMEVARFEAPNGIPLQFNVDAIKRNMVWGEAEAVGYFNEVVLPTIGRGEFKYTNNEVKISDEIRLFLEENCVPQYKAFKEHSREVLGL